MKMPTAEQMLKPRTQISLRHPKPQTTCKFCYRAHPTAWEIKCDCGSTIYSPFAEEAEGP